MTRKSSRFFIDFVDRVFENVERNFVYYLLFKIIFRIAGLKASFAWCATVIFARSRILNYANDVKCVYLCVCVMNDVVMAKLVFFSILRAIFIIITDILTYERNRILHKRIFPRIGSVVSASDLYYLYWRCLSVTKHLYWRRYIKKST